METVQVTALLLLVLDWLLHGLRVGALPLEPSFDVPMVNVTVREGITAVLPCSVKYLGQHQVVWTDQWSTLLTYEDRRIIDDERISVERPYTKDWNLHIRNVRYSDQGIFNCQINTDPIKIKTVNLKVQVPAKIISHLSSSDITAREGETVTLVCNVTGIPTPTVTWFRHRSKEDGEVENESEFCHGTDKIGVSGEVLIIHNISRYCGDMYECQASNNVPPDVSKQIKVAVEFSPEVRLPNKRMGQVVGKETILECVVTAFPQAVSVWMKGDKEITNTWKYRIEIYDEGQHTITLSLRIRMLDADDFGMYTCAASNPLGKDAEEMVLYDYTPKTTSTTTLASLLVPSITPRDNDVIYERQQNQQNRDTPWPLQPPSHPRTMAPPFGRPELEGENRVPMHHRPIAPAGNPITDLPPPLLANNGMARLCSGNLTPACTLLSLWTGLMLSGSSGKSLASSRSGVQHGQSVQIFVHLVLIMATMLITSGLL